jgi:hypothetical protein
VIRAWRAFVAACSAREDPLPLALVRVLLAAVILWDLALVGLYGMPPLIWAPRQAGGVVALEALQGMPSIVHLLPADRAAEWGAPLAWALFVGVTALAASFGAGLFTRTSAILFVLLYAQTQMLNDASDRGIDRLIRIVVLVLACSGAGRRLSVDARVRSGTWWGTAGTALAWPRYFLIFELTLVYVAAGMEKFALAWFPWGGSSALFIILQDPLLATSDFAWMAAWWAYPFTQLGTSGTHLWEWTFFAVPLALYFQATRTRPGRLRAAFNAWDVRMIYVIVGAFFHLSLAATLHLGIFPAAMLAMYPIFFHPDEIRAAARRAGRASPFRRRGGGRPGGG